MRNMPAGGVRNIREAYLVRISNYAAKGEERWQH